MKTITRLYADFESALSASKALPPLPQGVLNDPAFDRAVAKCSTIAWRIVKAPARSNEEMLLKIQIAAWCADVPRERFADWRPDELDSEQLHALASLRDDLRRMCA